jgi:hypothetical protein
MCKLFREGSLVSPSVNQQLHLVLVHFDSSCTPADVGCRCSTPTVVSRKSFLKSLLKLFLEFTVQYFASFYTLSRKEIFFTSLYYECS